MHPTRLRLSALPGHASKLGSLNGSPSPLETSTIDNLQWVLANTKWEVDAIHYQRGQATVMFHKRGTPERLCIRDSHVRDAIGKATDAIIEDEK